MSAREVSVRNLEVSMRSDDGAVTQLSELRSVDFVDTIGWSFASLQREAFANLEREQMEREAQFNREFESCRATMSTQVGGSALPEQLLKALAVGPCVFEVECHPIVAQGTLLVMQKAPRHFVFMFHDAAERAVQLDRWAEMGFVP